MVGTGVNGPALCSELSTIVSAKPHPTSIGFFRSSSCRESHSEVDIQAKLNALIAAALADAR